MKVEENKGGINLPADDPRCVVDRILTEWDLWAEQHPDKREAARRDIQLRAEHATECILFLRDVVINPAKVGWESLSSERRHASYIPVEEARKFDSIVVKWVHKTLTGEELEECEDYEQYAKLLRHKINSGALSRREFKVFFKDVLPFKFLLLELLCRGDGRADVISLLASGRELRALFANIIEFCFKGEVKCTL